MESTLYLSLYLIFDNRDRYTINNKRIRIMEGR